MVIIVSKAINAKQATKRSSTYNFNHDDFIVFNKGHVDAFLDISFEDHYKGLVGN